MLQLYKLATACDVVLCCRVAPLQKAGIVSLMKKRTTDMSLSIGDGMRESKTAVYHETLLHVLLSQSCFQWSI